MTSIEALVLQKEDKEGRLILSKKRAQYERAWGTIEKLKDEDGVVTGTVIEVVKGGLILDIGLRGFLPASLVEMRRVRDLQPYVGKELEAKIIELDKNRNNVVLSRRAWLEQTQSEVRSEFLAKLAKGQVRSGQVVSSIVNFGAFVDLGGVDGLVHVSELSWKHIDHPSEVVEVGQEVTVEVLDVDLERERVSLSLKATQEDPWRQFARTHAIGQVVPGQASPSWCRSVRSSGSARASRAWSTSPSWPSATSRSRSRSSTSATRSWSRSSTSTSSGAGSASRSSRPTTPSALGAADGPFDPTQYGMEAHLRRLGQLHLPRGLRPRDPGLAAGLRGAAGGVGGGSTPQAQERYDTHHGPGQARRRPPRPRPPGRRRTPRTTPQAGPPRSTRTPCASCGSSSAARTSRTPAP